MFDPKPQDNSKNEVFDSKSSMVSQKKPLTKPKFKTVMEEVVKKTKRKSQIFAVKPKFKVYHMQLTNQPRLLLLTPPSEKRNT